MEMNLGPLPLTLRQLQYVVAIATVLNFRRAAEDCMVSQPSLSAQLAEAEAALGVRLFERGRGGVLITPAGFDVVARARQVLLATEDLIEVARRHGNPLEGPIRIGVIPTIAPYLLPDLDPALRAGFSGLELLWTEEKTSSLVQSVNRGELDAAIVALESDLGDLEYEILGRDPFVIATAADHPLTRLRRKARLADLESMEALLLSDGHCFRDQARDLCSKAGATELGFRATSLATLSQMVAGGRGITLLPMLAVGVEMQRAGLAVRQFARPQPFRTIALAWRRGSALDSSLRVLAGVAVTAAGTSLGEHGRRSRQPK